MKIKKIILLALLISITSVQIAHAESTIISDIDMQIPAASVGTTITYDGTFSDESKYQLKGKVTKAASNDSPGEISVESLIISDNKKDLAGKQLALPSVFQTDGYDYIITEIHRISSFNDLNLVLPETVKTISENGFYNINNLTISLPASLEKVGDNIFEQTSIKKITIAKGNNQFKVDKNCLYSYDGKKGYYIWIPDSGQVLIKEGVKVLMPGSIPTSYNDKQIQELILPKSLTEIDTYISGVTYICFKGENPPNINSTIYDSYVMVPKKSLTKYRKLKSRYGKEIVFNSNYLFAENKYYNSAVSYFKTLKTKANLKNAEIKPKDLTTKQWNAIIKKVNSITKNAANDREKALLIYQWITSECYYDYDGVGSFSDGSGGVTYVYVPREGYNVKLNKTYTAFTKKVMIDYGFVNLTTAMMRAAGLPCYTILPKDINQSWGTHFYYYANAVYYDNEWHILSTARGCANQKYKNKLNNYEFYNKRYFDYSLKAWCLSVMDSPIIITDVIPK